MPRSRFAGSLSSPKVDVVVDMGNPFLNLTVDGFLKIGTGVFHVTNLRTRFLYNDGWDFALLLSPLDANGTYLMLKKMCKEGAYWGTIAGVYVGMEYGVERIRGTRDWKNAMIGGALTGALISAASNNSRDKIVTDAITGGAVATAAEFLNYLN